MGTGISRTILITLGSHLNQNGSAQKKKVEEGKKGLNMNSQETENKSVRVVRKKRNQQKMQEKERNRGGKLE